MTSPHLAFKCQPRIDVHQAVMEQQLLLKEGQTSEKLVSMANITMTILQACVLNGICYMQWRGSSRIPCPQQSQFFSFFD